MAVTQKEKLWSGER